MDALHAAGDRIRVPRPRQGAGGAFHATAGGPTRLHGGGISPIGALELAGAAGILVGLVEPFIGVLAAAGSLLLLTGALFAHARHRDTLHEAAPAVLFSLVDAAYLGLAAAGLR
jgi:hypothetical protein